MNTTRRGQTKLAVFPTGVANQFVVRRPDDERLPPEVEWKDYYIEFGGYFGSCGPHMFAAAPDMFEALTRIAERISDNGSWTLDDACRETAWVQAEARAALRKASEG